MALPLNDNISGLGKLKPSCNVVASLLNAHSIFCVVTLPLTSLGVVTACVAACAELLICRWSRCPGSPDVDVYAVWLVPLAHTDKSFSHVCTARGTVASPPQMITSETPERGYPVAGFVVVRISYSCFLRSSSRFAFSSSYLAFIFCILSSAVRRFDLDFRSPDDVETHSAGHGPRVVILRSLVISCCPLDKPFKEFVSSLVLVFVRAILSWCP